METPIEMDDLEVPLFFWKHPYGCGLQNCVTLQTPQNQLDLMGTMFKTYPWFDEFDSFRLLLRLLLMEEMRLY